MTIICNLFLLLVAGLSALIIPLFVSTQNLIGTGRLATPVTFFLVGAARWALLSAVLLIEQPKKGEAIGMVLIYAVLEIYCMMMASEGGVMRGLPGWLGSGMILIPVLLPLPLVSYALTGLPNGPWRALSYSAGIAVLGLSIMGLGTWEQSGAVRSKDDRCYSAGSSASSSSARAA
ncbi:MAG: hypothetical protein ABJF23_28510 [Bryobacteraceae bacterium]